MLRARVRRITGNTTHRAAHIEGDAVVADGALPTTEWVQIEPTHEGIFLLYFDAAGAGITDTWHQTTEQAKAQARFEFEIEDADWFDDGR